MFKKFRKHIYVQSQRNTKNDVRTAELPKQFCKRKE